MSNLTTSPDDTAVKRPINVEKTLVLVDDLLIYLRGLDADARRITNASVLQLANSLKSTLTELPRLPSVTRC